MSQLAGLTNEQIVFIYLRLKKYADYVNDLILEGYSTRKITIGFGDVQTETKITDDDLQIIMEIPVVQMYMSIEKSLAPIVELIKDSEPELYNKIEAMIAEVAARRKAKETKKRVEVSDESGN
jgi:hypothetical protein